MKNRLYNVIFPIWFLILFPIVWLIVLPANFIIDTIVILLALKLLKVTNLKETYKKTIIKVWLFGFIADFIGALLLIAIQFISTGTFMSDVVAALAYNPFTNIYALLITILAIIISAIAIYLFNVKISLKKVDLEVKTKKKIALALSIFTAPYLFLYPSAMLYKGNQGSENLPEVSKLQSEFSGDTITTRIFAESENYTNTSFLYIDKIANVDSEVVESNTGSVVNMKISTDFNENSDINEYKKWAKQCSMIVFIKQPTINEVAVYLKNDNKEEICKLTYIKSELENEYSIAFEELEKEAVKLQNILNSIK
ncbi:MAG: hypothetical protein PHP54_02905 [Clostridia bacterium]|nr:hypothetical protein [Clostridia bacterium]